MRLSQKKGLHPKLLFFPVGQFGKFFPAATFYESPEDAAIEENKKNITLAAGHALSEYL